MDIRFYVLVNIETLKFYSSSSYDEKYSEETIKFDSIKEAKCELDTFDECIKYKYKIYCVKEKIEREFDLIEENY